MSTASSTPAGGWYADPLDASLLRWWDGATWSKQTMPSDPALSASNEGMKPSLAAVPPLLIAVPRSNEPYVPPNSVFRMAEATAGDAYVPEWSGLVDISDEVALSGVPVQLALTSTPSEPPIPVSADVFPTLRGESTVTPAIKEPSWNVEAPLAAPVDQLFPVASAAAAFPTAAATPVVQPTPAAPAAVDDPMPASSVVSLGAAISPAAPLEPALSAAVFPVSAPVIAPTPAPVLVPQPAGDAFPGIVPSVAPTMYAEPPAPGEPVSPAAPPAPGPFTPMPPEPTVYAGPPPVEVGPNPVAPPEFQPFATSTPGATYVPHTPRPVPQPLQLGAPTAPPAAAPPLAATPSELVPATPQAPVEYWPTQGTPVPGVQYQPNPGDYVPFDPNSVHLEPVPVIPFSSRDPYNSASTARPGMRAYAAAPVGPSGSTWTGGLAFMILAPLISAATLFVWSQLTTTAGLTLASASWLPFALGGISLIGLASAQIDRSTLARRGYFDLASPFWVLLIPPLIYLIVRATRLRGQGRGAAPAIGLWALSYIAGNVLIGVILVGWMAAPTPERVASIETAIQHQLATKNITATVDCPAVTSFAPGTSFDCTMTSQGSKLPIRVTVQDWQGDYTVATGSVGSNS